MIRVRRFFRFGLRTLLVLLTLFSVWLGFTVSSARRQHMAVEAIRDYGGFAYYDYEVDESGQLKQNVTPWEPRWLLDTIGVDFFHDVVFVNLVYGSDEDTGQRINVDRSSDAIVRRVTELPRLEWLLLAEKQATDEAMQHVAELSTLQHLYMWDAASLTDDGVEQLRGLRRLEYVHINNAKISDESVRCLASCPNIEGLSLQGNRFTNKCLEYASRLPRLKSLVIGLGEISVSDGGLVYLEKLKRLEKLGLQRSHVTEAGILRHLPQLPRLKTLWLDDEHLSDDGRTELQRALPGLKLN